MNTSSKTWALWLAVAASVAGVTFQSELSGRMDQKRDKRPNILFAISDDQSWVHTGAHGSTFVQTPAFDRVAREGVLFENGFVPAPQCSPARASLLTGRNPWQNGDAAVHGSVIPTNIPVYPRLLEKSGYHVGMTGKGWGPGPRDLVKNRNPAGKVYGTNKNDQTGHEYTDSFRAFLAERRPGQPFCFWYGSREPHRPYKRGSGLQAGKMLASVTVPKFLPDHESVRSDLLDYALEIELFDAQLGQMLDILEDMGELDDTIVVVTSDNGMPWSRAKANLYEYGVHVPLAIQWRASVPGRRTVTSPVSVIDLAPTYLEAAGLALPEGMSGRSLLPVLESPKSGWVDESRDFVVLGKERHTPWVRVDDVGYPSRAIRTDRYLYIRNLEPDRWPEGDTFYCGGPSSSRTLYLERREELTMQRYIRLAWAKRPAEELYDVRTDLDCLNNIASAPAHAEVRKRLRNRLNTVLREQADPRMAGGDHYARYDRQPYFEDYFEELRSQLLKQVQPVHDVMEKVGWK